MAEVSPGEVDCPVCDSSDVDYWKRIGSWVCDNCSYVFEPSDSDCDSSPAEVATSVSTETPDEEQAWQDQVVVKDNSDANLVQALSQVETVVDSLDSSTDVTVRTAEVLTAAWESNFMHGRTMSDTVAGSVYLATRDVGDSVPPGLIAEQAGTDKQAVKDIYLRLKDRQETELDTPTPSEYVPYIRCQLNLPPSVTASAKELLSDSKSHGGNPIAIAAAAVYAAADKHGTSPTLREVAEVATFTKETVWRHASQLRTE